MTALAVMRHTPLPAASPLAFGFIVTRYPYHLWETYAEAADAKASLQARSRRPAKFVLMKELAVAGEPRFFVTNYKYIQKTTLTEARMDFAKPDMPRPLSRREKKLRRKQKPEDKRIRCIINCSGAPAAALVAEAGAFFARELAAARGLTETERRALGLNGESNV